MFKSARILSVLCVLALSFSAQFSAASEFNEPWRVKSRALIIDGYEHNQIDLVEMVKDKRIAAFIHKGSDGVSPPYRCKGTETEQDMCKIAWRKYAVGRELYHTRRALAKALGLKWGAYHLGRPGDPLEQARHFLDYAEPADDETMVLDIEENDPEKWMSLPDAERFANYIKTRTGRYPMLYTNGSTAKYIADNRHAFPVLSRLQLWYARYKPTIDDHFPKGNWQSYDIWQFASQTNCNNRRCPYRVKGAGNDIDVNVVDMTVDELHAAWPFGGLVDFADPEAIIMAEAAFNVATRIKLATMPIISDKPLTLADVHRAHAVHRGAMAMPKFVDMETTSSIEPAAIINDLY